MTVYIEPIKGQGFRATTEEPYPLAAEGGTRDEALSRLEVLVRDRLAAGEEARIAGISPEDHPLVRRAGDLEDDPLLDRWKEAMAEYRLLADIEEGIRRCGPSSSTPTR